MDFKKIVFSVLSISLFSVPAYGYIDPGTGSMWLQTIIALIAGGGFTLKAYWQKLKFKFSKNKNQINDSVDTAENNKS